jgi:hypothetical protein
MEDQSLRVVQHQVIGALGSLEGALVQATERATDDPNALTLIARLMAMREHAHAALVGADPSLVTDHVLNAAFARVQELTAAVTNYAHGSAIGHLNNAMVHADGLFGDLARVPLLITGARASAVSRALGAYHHAVEEYTEAVRDQQARSQDLATRLTSSLSALEQRVASTETRVDGIIVQYQSTFESTQAQRQQAFDSAQSQRHQTVESQLSAYREEFNELARELRTAHATLVDSAKSELAGAVGALNDAIEKTKEVASVKALELDTEYRAVAEDLKAHLEQRRKEADELVGLVGERGVTSTYQKTANEARLEMYVWQVLTVCVMALLLAGAIFEFVPALKNGWNWGVGGARLMVATIATLLASYAGTQAKIARDTVRKNRRREMDLAAIGPYLASLPESEQHEIRTRVADRYFVEDDGTTHAAPAATALLQDPDIMAAVSEIPKAALLTAIRRFGK